MEEQQRDWNLERLVANINTIHLPPNSERTHAGLGILTKNVWASLQCRDWVGVQALPGPVGQIQVLHAEHRRITLEREVVQARTRRYCARWTVTDAGFSFDRKLTQEMAEEIDQDILHGLRCVAPMPTEEFDASRDDHHKLAKLLSLAALEISFASRRHHTDCTYAVLSQTAYDIASRHPLFDCGRLWLSTGRMRLFVDPHAYLTTPILVGQKGLNQVDAGYFWAPYQLICPHHVLVDPNSFELIMSFTYRYGLIKHPNHEGYFRLIDYKGVAGEETT